MFYKKACAGQKRLRNVRRHDHPKQRHYNVYENERIFFFYFDYFHTKSVFSQDTKLSLSSASFRLFILKILKYLNVVY